MFQVEENLSKNPKWLEVKEVLKGLSSQGYQVVLAGGGVRDSLLGLIPKDFDIATSAKPEEVLKVFPEAKNIWSKYGNISIPFKKFKGHVDVTTFRKELSYQDGRHPDGIEYASIEEDARRRDFTINALFYDMEQQKIIDFVDGLKDLETKTLRAVGDCKKKFEEDHLRILRALRFSHQFGFSMEQQMQEAISSSYKKLSKISQERITSELFKMLSVGEIGKGLNLLNQYHVLNLVFHLPNAFVKNPHFFWKQKFSFCSESSYIWTVVGLPYFQKEETFKFYLQQLKISSHDIKKSLSYFKSFQNLVSSSSSLANQLKSLNPYFDKIKELSLLWCKGYQIESQSLHTLFKKFNQMGEWPKPLVTSKDLFTESCFPKIKFSYLLDKAFDLQIENPQKSKEDILKDLKKYYLEESC